MQKGLRFTNKILWVFEKNPWVKELLGFEEVDLSSVFQKERAWKQLPSLFFYKMCPSSDIRISLPKMKSAFQTVARSI